MERVTVSLDDDLLAQFDAFIQRKGYGNRSEAVRDVLRDRLEADRLAEGSASHCIGCLSYVFNHHERDLAARMTRLHHGRHDLIRSTMHVHLDHEACLEVSLLEGPTAEVRALADALIAETGVRHGRLSLIPVDLTVTAAHSHDRGPGRDHGHDLDPPHRHVHPKT
jgi:CopG family nickel-responsive transcriptional regulator